MCSHVNDSCCYEHIEAHVNSHISLGFSTFLWFLFEHLIYKWIILFVMEIDDLIMFYSQRIQERENYNMKPQVIESMQKGLNLQVGNYASTPFEETMHQPLNGSGIQRSELSYNHTGMSFVNLNHISHGMQESQQLPLTQQITTTINNFDDYQRNEHRSNNEFQLPIGETAPLTQKVTTNFDGDQDNGFQLLIGETVPMSSVFGLVDQSNANSFGDRGDASMISSDFVFTANSHSRSDQGDQIINATMETNANIFSNGFDYANFVGTDGSTASEDLAPFDRFGIPIGPCVGNGMEGSSNVDLDVFMIPEFILNDPKAVSHPQDFQGRVNFRHGNTNFSGLSVSAMENNNEAQIMKPPASSNVPLDDSEGTLIDNYWHLKMINYDQNDSPTSNNMSYYGSM